MSNKTVHNNGVPDKCELLRLRSPASSILTDSTAVEDEVGSGEPPSVIEESNASEVVKGEPGHPIEQQSLNGSGGTQPRELLRPLS